VKEVVNVFEAEVQYHADDPAGYAAGYLRLRPLIGGVQLGATIYELATGQSICPYHYEYGNEEWLIVLEGRPVLRTPEGEVELEPGDVVCFPEGPDGAHKVTNRGEGSARVLMLSTQRNPDVSVYPDSDKIGVFPGNDADRVIFPRSAGVDYWAGEVESA
jgi:uncharacterized cupin superfamily protein